MGNNKRPDIRFSGFSQNWEVNRLGEIYNVYSGQTPSRSNLSNFNNPTTAWIKTTDLNNSSIKVNQENISKKAAEKLKILKEDTVLIAMYGGFNQIGRTGILTYPATINQALSALEPIEKINPYFLLTVLNYKVNEWKRLAASSRKDPNITKRDVEDFLLRYPLFQEQVKLGGFFKNLDNAISLQQQELTILKQTKQGFLQKMFPKEGEAVPEVRFSGFTEHWTRRKFSEIATIRRGLTYKPSDISKNGVRVLRSSNINEDTFELKSDDVFVNKDAVKIALVKENDILITSANGSSRLVGKHALVKDIETNAVHGGFMLLATSSQPYFVNSLMSSSWYDKFINIHVSGGNGSIGNLSKGDLENQIIFAPSIEEQIQIGNFFKQLDEVIALHERELEALQQTKKAFLQKMFV